MTCVVLNKPAAACAAALLTACLGTTAGAAVYVAETADAVPHFASHPPHGAFELLIRDDPPAQPAAATVRAHELDPALKKRRAQLDPLIERVASRQNVEPALVRAVIEVESQFHVHALSPKGALGAMQLMPQTARRYGVADRRDPAQNIEAGVAYLKICSVDSAATWRSRWRHTMRASTPWTRTARSFRATGRP
jgi:membrane-bound lytic murein transglycosylase B